MTLFVRLGRPGYGVAALAVILAIAFLVTGSAEGALVVALLEGVFWACLQYFKDRRGEPVKPLS